MHSPLRFLSRSSRFTRSALATGLATATLGLAAAVGAPAASALGSSNGTVATPNIPRCESDIVVLVPGGGNTVPGLPDNFPVGAYVSDLGAMVEKLGYSTSRTVSYNAAPFVETAYTESRADGVAKTRQLVAQTAAQCPSSTISLAGYSLGADVASRVVADIANGSGPIDSDKFGSAALISNPNRSPETVPGGSARGNEGVFGALDGGYGELTDRVMDVCNSADYICNSTDRTQNTRAHATEFTEFAAERDGDQVATASPSDAALLAAEVPFDLVPGQAAHATSYGGNGGVNPAYGFLNRHF
ncbi:MAG TPA: cutinase family protein [Candidatus Corynebacterium avicola]|uniref:Cutinase family protein n=1 Tax=Candidatus Corynebacterium avicola TaxID=2838527 RepID=A0A9D1UL99_9CORY|nr:cutinase family protein [Candidatus Corynebacterium avicola]